MVEELSTKVEASLGHVYDGKGIKRTQSGAKIPEDEQHAAHIIARNFYARRYSRYVQKKILVERLFLEDVVGRGVVRLTVYSLLFIFMVSCLNFGSDADSKRSVATLLRADLGLEDWLEVTSIGQLREMLPQLSQSLKKYSASSSSRFSSDDSVIILGENQKFQIPRQLFTVDPVVSGDFTFTAWVGGFVTSNPQIQIPILRRPMETDTTKSCWGWFHPSTFRFGAHDFHSNDDGSFDQSVNGPQSVPPSLTHEAIIVKDNFVSFFRDGKRIGDAQPLPRPITDCLAPAPLELGGDNIELSALLYYPRALQPTEIEEMFQAGQPLVEVATASTLSTAEASDLVQVESSVTVSSSLTMAEIQKTQLENRINAIMNAQSSTTTADQLSPEDFSPPPILPKGDDAVTASLATTLADGAEVSNQQYWLDSDLRKRWIEGGRMTTGYMNSTWATDSIGTYYSLFEHPILGDGTPFGQLPNFNQNSDGMTISFWFKASKLKLGKGPNLRVVQGPGLEMTTGGTYFDVAFDLDWVQWFVNHESIVPQFDPSQFAYRYMTGYDANTGEVNEDFLLYAFAKEPQPNVWRHVVCQYSMTTRSILFYLDGVLMFDTKDKSKYSNQLIKTSATVADLFNGATVIPSAWDDPNFRDVSGAMAQMRFYDKLLSADEVQVLHTTAEWPNGVKIKQCVNGRKDMDFADTLRTDSQGNPCSWWFSVAQEFAWVCSAPWLKEMCPVTCSGARLCHDGSLNQGDPVKISPRRKFRIFDRIMYLKPKQGQTGLVCPSDRLNKEQLLADCKVFEETPNFYDSNPRNFTRLFLRANEDVQRADIRKCDKLEEVVDFEQCAWNSSWIEEFALDWEESKQWSISTWIRPKEGSRGMPTNFWFALSVFSTLSPPLILGDFTEIQPKLEPWLDAYVTVEDPARDQTWDRRASVWPTTSIDYANAWTFLHMQFQENPDGTSTMCATLNAMKLSCVSDTFSHRFEPLRFIEGFELTTEMLISPIEVTTSWFTPSEVQRKYYAKAPSMAKVLGPLKSERDRIEEAKEELVRDTTVFDQTVVLMAPPLIFQQRAEKRSCGSRVTTPFLEAQLKLMRAAMCTDAFCPGAVTIDSVATCIGDADNFTGTYFGLERTPLDGQVGYTDFLYALADNPFVVREGNILSTETFFDGQSTEGTILAFFHLPATGLTTELKLTVSFTGTALETDFGFEHYGFVSEQNRPELLGYYAVVFLLILFILVANFKFFLNFRNEVRILGVEFDEKGRFEITYDLVQCTIVVVFAFMALSSALQTEDKALGIVEGLANVPFESSTITLKDKISQFFVAVETLHQGLADNANLDNFAFAVMVLMLVRILDATAVHPRTGVLVGTLLHGLNDLWHFTILFLVVFFFFAFTSNWMFASERDDFADMFASMQTQFNIIMGELPENFENDDRMIVYVVFSIVVQFFLMLNFLLAIVVEGYMKVRLDIEANESEQEFVTDVVKTIYAYFKGLVHGWPHRRRVALIVRDRVGSRAVSGYHLLLQGLSHEAVGSMFTHYANISHLQCGPPEWLLPANRYEVVERVEKEAMKISIEHLNSQMSAMRLQLGRLLKETPSAVSGPSSPMAKMTPMASNDGGIQVSQAIHQRILNKPALNKSNGARRYSMDSKTEADIISTNGNGVRTKEEQAVEQVLDTDDDTTSAKNNGHAHTRTVDLMEAAVNGRGLAEANGSERVRDEDFLAALQGGPGLQELGEPTFML